MIGWGIAVIVGYALIITLYCLFIGRSTVP
jgi:hypothetical protein